MLRLLSIRSQHLQTQQRSLLLLTRSLSTQPVLDESSSSSTSNNKESSTKKRFQSTPERKYQYFENVEYAKDGQVAIVRFDNPDKPVNTISFNLKDEAAELWNKDVEGKGGVKAVVFSSAKKDNFIAGADIGDIRTHRHEISGVIEEAMEFFQNMKKANIVKVSAIHGAALGGGLEWALWCDYRVCSDSEKTKMGLPEVKLGLLPGFGGTQNLYPLIGTQAALDMMLTGKEVRPDKAKKLGLVDLVVAPQSLETVAVDSALGLANGTLKAKRKKKSWMNWVIEDTPLGQNKMWKEVKKMVDKNTNGNYPAPYAIMESVLNGQKNPSRKYKFERESFAKLATTNEADALIGIFEGMTSLKKHSYGELAHSINSVAVLGAGLMGAGIAQVTAEKGVVDNVLLKDRNDTGIYKGQKYINENWEKKVKRKRMTNYKYNINNSRIVPLTDDSPAWKTHFGRADLIIEAVFEDLDLKRRIVADMEAVTPHHCIFATNTSAIPIKDIAQGSKRPEHIVGMHYFSPVPSMPLLEIIPHEGTADYAVAAALEVGTKQGKTCIPVKDVPGFYVNRCLGPFLVEVAALVQDGVSLETLDNSMKDFGMPVGPITLADEVGIDVTSHVASFLANADLGVRMEGGDISLMSNMVEKGWLGRKSGQGFYTYASEGKKTNKKIINADVKSYVQSYVNRDLGLTKEEVQNRIISRFINEAAKCLEDEIISSPVVGDIGLVFGTGFAPFRGGPFRYLDHVGVSNFVSMMNSFTDTYGPQFEPCQLLKDYAKHNKRFHSND